MDGHRRTLLLIGLTLAAAAGTYRLIQPGVPFGLAQSHHACRGSDFAPSAAIFLRGGELHLLWRVRPNTACEIDGQPHLIQTLIDATGSRVP